MASNDIRMRVLLNVEGKNIVVEVSSSVKELQNALEATKNKAEKMRVAMSHLANISVLANNAMTGFHNLGAAMQPFIDKANNAAVVQTKLKTMMEQRMRATQVATFASSRQTLETLLPAMNNLIAQQKGLNATSEDAVTIASMVGKAFMGLSA